MALLKRKRSVLVEANDVSIITACRLIGMELPDSPGYGRALKLHCPFGALWHSDAGRDPTMRLYLDNNTAYCFSRCGFFTPVSLVAMAFNLPRKRAALELLERAGRKPLSLTDTWAELTAHVEPEPDRTMLTEALKTYCARVAADWADRQYDPVTAALLSRCLDLLDLVHTTDEAQRWLSGSKTVMTTALNR